MAVDGSAAAPLVELRHRDMVLIDMLMRASQGPHRHARLGTPAAETYNVMDATREPARAGSNIFPQAEAVQAMVDEHGLGLFYHSVEFRKMCCGVRRWSPLGGRSPASMRGSPDCGANSGDAHRRAHSGVGRVEQPDQVQSLADWTHDEV